MSLRDALKMLKPYRVRVMAIMALALIISAISAASPFVSREMFDTGLLQGNTRAVIRYVSIFLLMQVGGQIIEYLQRTQEISVSNDLGKNMKIEAFEHGLKLKPRYFKEHGFYKTIGDAIYDISNIMSIANNSIFTIFVVVCKCIGAAVGLVILDWRLSIMVATIVPVKAWLNNVMRNKVEKHNKRLMEDSKKYNSWFSNIISGIVDIKLWNLEKKTINEYGGHVQTINESSKKLSLMSAKNLLFGSSVEELLINMMYILGAFLIEKEHLTFGGLIAFITFATYVLAPINVMLEIRIILKQITPNVVSLRHFYELEEENYSTSETLPDKISVIEFKNVSLTIDGRDILKNLDMKINRGEKIAIIGDNGSGKTSFINMLLRFVEPSSGEILIDGVPTTEYNIEDYRRKFSVVTQDIHLFNRSIKENITFNANATITAADDELLKFCTEMIEGWGNKYETQVGSEGTKLSGGERQKIALLRALYRKTDILVLDEPTSNYDRESEQEFNRWLQHNNDYDFYFIVTHRKDVLSCADKVLMLQDEKISALNIN
jgi:ABC-type bacteriocin/lantibiotic exporter with double-glycine peptidase domain